MVATMVQKLCGLVFLMTLTAGVAFGQSGTATCTKVLGTNQVSGACTIALGGAKLTYNYNDLTNRTCVDRHDNILHYEYDTISAFNYEDAKGNTSPVAFSFSRFVSPGNSSNNCPKPSSFPASASLPLTGNIADFGTAITFLPPSNQASLQTLDVGSMSPKFEVVAVMYAPPGGSSNVAYGSSTMLGVTNTLANSFMNATTTMTGVTLKDTGIPDILGSSVSETSTTGFTQTTSGSNSIAINKTTTRTEQINGPLNSAAGVDHNYDQIEIWLNPVVLIEHFNNNVVVGEDGSDPRDTPGELDTIPLFVKDLKSLMNGTFTGDPDIPMRLARGWAGTGQGLTSADYATILARDPFANGSTTIDPTRFQLNGQNFNYIPPPGGGQPDKTTLGINYTTATTESEMASDAYSVATTFDLSETFLGFITSELKETNTLTWTSSSTQQVTETTGQTATLTLVGPPIGYTGPTNLIVYVDNIYGTFMFNLIP